MTDPEAWHGYGPPADPDQWRAAAEWIHCAAIHIVSTCIECGDEFEGTGDICSAGCGYALTGEYPDLYEKDYGDEDVNPSV